MGKILFDAHAHINEGRYSDEDREALAREIEDSQLAYVMDQGFDLPSSRQAIRDAEKYDWCYCVVGVHPHDAKSMDDSSLDEIRAMSKEPKVCGIGEIGLDFYYDHSEREVQREWFRKQIQLANELHLPIVIHSRDADQETMDILKEEGAFSEERKRWFPPRFSGEGAAAREEMQQSDACDENGTPALVHDDARVLIHCFSGSAELAKQYVKLGATISICGPVTFKNNRKTVEVVQEIPIEYLTIETDSPYLTPEPKRGRPNRSPYVEYVARRVAILKGMTYEEVAKITCENAKRFYNIQG